MREAVDVHHQQALADVGEDGVVKLEEAHLHATRDIAVGLCDAGCSGSADVDLGAEARDFVDVSGLELTEDVGSTVGDATWHTAEARNLDTEAMFAPPADELAKEEHTPVDLAGGDVVVLHALETTLEVIELVVVRSEEGLGRPWGLSCRYSMMAQAMEIPS